jgi:hypothetical protein
VEISLNLIVLDNAQINWLGFGMLVNLMQMGDMGGWMSVRYNTSKQPQA